MEICVLYEFFLHHVSNLAANSGFLYFLRLGF